MGEQISQIKTTFSNLIEIYNQTSSFILDAGSMMEKLGYQCTQGNSIGTFQSKDIRTPSKWFPGYVGKYFSRKGANNEIKAIGILFVDLNDEPIDAIILLSTFNMTENAFKSRCGWLPQYAWHDIGDNKPMKTVMIIPENKKWNMKGAKMMAIPIEDIKDQKALEEKVVMELAKMTL